MGKFPKKIHTAKVRKGEVATQQLYNMEYIVRVKKTIFQHRPNRKGVHLPVWGKKLIV